MNRLLFLMTAVLISSDINADSFRCGRKVVKLGESGNALIKKCGDPIRKYSSNEVINDRGHQLRASVSNWVYERRGKKDMIVSVHRGKVMKLQID